MFMNHTAQLPALPCHLISHEMCSISLNHFFVTLLQSFLFFPLCPPLPIPSPTPTVNSHTVVHVCGSFIYVLCLVPSPSFPHYPPLPAPLVTVSSSMCPRLGFCFFFFSLCSTTFTYIYFHEIRESKFGDLGLNLENRHDFGGPCCF